MSDFNLVTANKTHICTTCKNKIPKGAKYWSDYCPVLKTTISKEHTNCEMFTVKEYRCE